MNPVGKQLIDKSFINSQGSLAEVAFVSVNWYWTLIYPTTEPDIMPLPDETTPLVPAVRKLNWRQKCFKIFYWSGYFVYFLLLLVDVARWMLIAAIIICTPFDVRAIAYVFDPQQMFQVDLLVAPIILNLVDASICWIFLGFVARSPGFIGCFTVFKNLVRLPRFWTLVSLVVLYILGAAILLWHLFSSALKNQDATVKTVFVMEVVMEVLSVFTTVVVVVVLNYVQVRNVARSRFKYTLLKGTLVVIWLSQICILIGAMETVYLIVLLPIATGNSHVQQEGSFRGNVLDFFVLPIVARTTELIWTKIFQDNKCIIGKNESSSFTRQNPRVSNAIERIIWKILLNYGSLKRRAKLFKCKFILQANIKTKIST